MGSANLSPQRIVHCEDAIPWLQRSHILTDCSVIASIPDISEFPRFTLELWKDWFASTAALIFSKTPPEGVTIFYQSDIKSEGTWVDKGYLCQKAAELAGQDLLWHKIICRVPPGITTPRRSSYTHILCFSKGVRVDDSQSTPDVLPEMGEKTWERGMGLEACLMMGNFIARQTTTKTIAHIFCGQGSMLAMANELGLSAIGVERSQKCAEMARTLKVDLKTKKWIGGEEVA
jgi:hypothetical protein